MEKADSRLSGALRRLGEVFRADSGAPSALGHAFRPQRLRGAEAISSPEKAQAEDARGRGAPDDPAPLTSGPQTHTPEPTVKKPLFQILRAGIVTPSAR